MTSPADRERRLRLFVAAALPDDVTTAIGCWQERELAPRRELRITRSLHLTLCFIGDTPASALEPLTVAMAPLRIRPMTVAVAGPVLFLPDRGKRRVVALALKETRGDPTGLERLRETQTAVSEALVGTGLYEPPGRAWLPHLTVARFRRPGQPFSLQNVNCGELCLSEVVLYTSDLDRSGAIHTPLASFGAR